MDRDTTPTASTSSRAPAAGAKYRGAVVEDLQLPPAFCLPQEAPLSAALEAAYEREFDQLPILNERRKPIGYLDIPGIKAKAQRGAISPEQPLSSYATHFPMSSRAHPYTVITPDTPLEELEAFFVNSGVEFALVTDSERKWVLAVATKGDLEMFVTRRG